MIAEKLILPLFVLMVVAQIFVPARMIWKQERMLAKGTEFKFLTRTVDPSDPFRGQICDAGL